MSLRLLRLLRLAHPPLALTLHDFRDLFLSESLEVSLLTLGFSGLA